MFLTNSAVAIKTLNVFTEHLVYEANLQTSRRFLGMSKGNKPNWTFLLKSFNFG